MFKTSKLATAIKLASVLGVTSAAFINPVYAQETAEGADKAVEKIEVLGSRIRRTDIEGANPVQTLTQVDIEKFGVTSIGDVLQNIPAAGSAINTNNNNGGNGTTTVNIRGIGSNRTLVLVNGKRWAPGLGGSVDLNNIPAAIIERIEILKDGASAVYGSDAIAGVVNIVTRTDFEGMHASGYMGEYLSEGDGNREMWDVGFGTSTDRGNIYFNVSYVEEEPTFAGDRAISAVPVFGAPQGFGGSSGTPNGRLFYWNADGVAQNVQGDGNGGLIPWTGASAFNFAPFNYLSTPQERTNIYTQGSYQLTDDITAKVTAFYGNRKSEQALAPTPLFFGSNFGAPGRGFNIPANHPFNPTGIDLSSDSAAGSPGHLLLIGRRMMEAGFRSFNQNVDQIQFNGGLEGVFELGGTELFWDVGYTFADITQNQLTTGLLNMDRVRVALGDVDVCAATSGCTPLNIFGGATDIGVGTMTQEMLDFITFTAQDALNSQLESYTANLSGELFELPAGYLAFAAGYEKRWQSGFDQPDALTAAGISSGNIRQPTRGSFSVEEYYLELAIPLLSDMPLVDRLDLELASRYSDYSNFGDTTNSKVGIKWRVTDDLLIRGTFSEAFRAPAISELFLGNSDSFATLVDPCNGGAVANPGLPGCAGVPAGYEQPNPQIRTVVGGNVNLLPEEAESFTAGFVYSPSAIEGLSFTFDIFDVEVTNNVGSVGALTILNACAVTGTTFCDLVGRNDSGAVVDLFNGLVNTGSLTTSGFDAAITYKVDTDFGAFAINWDATYIDERTTILEDPVTGEVTEFNDAGRANDRDVVPRVRSNLNLNWAMGDFTANWLVRYIHGTTEPCALGAALVDSLCSAPSPIPAEGTRGPSFNRLRSMAYHDVSVGYAVNENMRITVGVNNLLDNDPPVSFSTFANSFDPSMYEVPGQFIYSRVSLEF